MRPLIRTIGHDGNAAFVDEAANTFGVIHLTGNQDFQSFSEAYQSPVKHPVGCPGQCKSVADDVGSVGVDRAYVRGIHFGAPATVDQLEPRQGTTLAICAQYGLSECTITNDP